MTSIAQAIGQEYEQKGIRKGIQKGRQEGIQKGIQKGRQEGRQEGEHNKALHIAKNMLDSNESRERIHQFTGLSWIEVDRLLRDHEASKK